MGGICGSDLHAYLHPESVPIDLKRILGHEFSGVIEEVGLNVDDLQPGDRVCIYPMLFNNPDNAINERFKTLDAVGAQIDGGFADYAILPEKAVFKIPKNLPLDIAAMVGLGLNVNLLDLRSRALKPLMSMTITSILVSNIAYILI